MKDDQRPFGLNWRQMYVLLLLFNALLIILFVLFTQYFS